MLSGKIGDSDFIPLRNVSSRADMEGMSRLDPDETCVRSTAMVKPGTVVKHAAANRFEPEPKCVGVDDT